MKSLKRGWDKSPSLSIVFGLSSKMQWLSGGGTTKSTSNE
ncbi:Peptide deformylase [Streptococcus sp. DD13]|nr:Peptide deformylase [Streptococcus sp. DD13]